MIAFVIVVVIEETPAVELCGQESDKQGNNGDIHQVYVPGDGNEVFILSSVDKEKKRKLQSNIQHQT